MIGPLKTEPFREIGGRLPQGGLALSAVITLIAMVAFGPVLPRPGLWPVALPSAATTADSDDESNWAGHLENPGQAARAAQNERLTSASYTSGFDKVAAGVAPTSEHLKPQARDPQACPGDLNCAFRAAKSPALPPRRPTLVATAPASAAIAAPASALTTATATSATNAIAVAPVVPAALPPQPEHRHDFAFLPRLPSPHTLLRPFTFVADQFTGLIKKL